MSGSLRSVKGSVQQRIEVYYSFSKRNLYLIPIQDQLEESMIVPLNEIKVDCSETIVQLTFYEAGSCHIFSFSSEQMNQNIWTQLKKEK